MADIEVVTNITGLDELETTLNEGGKQAAVKFLRKVEKTAARIFQTAAEGTAPYDTGNLAENIGIGSSLLGDTLTVRVGPRPAAFYGLFQEFGAPEAHVPAQHWLSRAFDETKDEALNEVVNTATETLNDLAKKK
jgi:HK97 gp10 family phage protein